MPRRKGTPKLFIGIDGEAIDSKYVLIGTSTGKCLEDNEGIKTDNALNFLWSLGNNRHLRKQGAVFVGFYFAYDVEMICRDLPDNIKQRLFHPRFVLKDDGKFYKDRIFYKNFELTYIKRKFFSIRRKDTQQNGITIYDACGFFVGQGSFIEVLKAMKIPVPAEIVSGKAERNIFSWENYETIKKYCLLECELLSLLMNKIKDMTDKQGLTPRRWYGSSALANLALRKWSIRDYMRRTVEENMSGYFWDLITRAYFGGWIEAHKLGSFKKVHSYDINSAYPNVIKDLPSTRDNRFIYTRTFRKGFGVWKVRYKFPESAYIGLFPFRLPNGAIKFPLEGYGCYWSPEVELALKLYPNCVDVVDGYYLEKTRQKTPLQKIVPELYRARQKYKTEGDLTQWILKILLNALYGKFAQKVGRADFKNFTWAGFITSATRARLREAVAGQEKHIIAFATDGIYSLKKLNGLKLSKQLGDWDYSVYDNATVLMSGVYLLEGKQGIKTGKRGFASLSAWASILEQLTADGKAEIMIRLFVGFNMAFNFPLEYGQSYLRFIEREKILNPRNLTKRKYFINEIKNWETDYCDSKPIKKLAGLSAPIKTAIEFIEDSDLIFADCDDEIVWKFHE